MELFSDLLDHLVLLLAAEISQCERRQFATCGVCSNAIFRLLLNGLFFSFKVLGHVISVLLVIVALHRHTTGLFDLFMLFIIFILRLIPCCCGQLGALA